MASVAVVRGPYPRPIDERDAQDDGVRARGQDRDLRVPLRAAVVKDRAWRHILRTQRPCPVQHEVGRERGQPQAPPAAAPCDLHAGLDVDAPGEIGLPLAAIGIRERCAVQDHIRPRGFEGPVERAIVEEITVDDLEARRHGRPMP